MTPSDIKKALSSVSAEIPVQAIKAAVEQQEAITPVLLKALDAVKIREKRSCSSSKARLAVHGLYLLAEFAEPKAWPLVQELFSSMSAQDNVSIGDDFDEIVCDSLSQIFATLCDGDIRPLQSIIENTSIDEYVRDAALSALVVRYQQDDLELSILTEYLHQLYKFGLEQERNQVWNAWVQACYNTQPDEFMDALESLYEQELADPYYITLEELTERCGMEPEAIRKAVMSQEADYYCYITDAIAGLRKLSCYSGESNELLKSMENMVINQTAPVTGPVSGAMPEASPLPAFSTDMPDYHNVGRNDPCPCGSGKKFKKCCLH